MVEPYCLYMKYLFEYCYLCVSFLSLEYFYYIYSGETGLCLGYLE